MQAVMETIFESSYLIFTIIAGIYILIKSNKRKEFILFGIATVLLVIGDAFHLIPRMIGLVNNDLESYHVSLGIGKLITSITMTIFYVLFYFFIKIRNEIKIEKTLDIIYLSLALIRLVLLTFPQNEWTSTNPNYIFGIIRNIPFIIMGMIVINLCIMYQREDKYFKYSYIFIALSFMFYLMTVLLSPMFKIFGLMMLPKTICYVILVIFGIRAVKKKEEAID